MLGGPARPTRSNRLLVVEGRQSCASSNTSFREYVGVVHDRIKVNVIPVVRGAIFRVRINLVMGNLASGTVAMNACPAGQTLSPKS